MLNIPWLLTCYIDRLPTSSQREMIQINLPYKLVMTLLGRAITEKSVEIMQCFNYEKFRLNLEIFRKLSSCYLKASWVGFLKFAASKRVNRRFQERLSGGFVTNYLHIFLRLIQMAHRQSSIAIFNAKIQCPHSLFSFYLMDYLSYWFFQFNAKCFAM